MALRPLALAPALALALAACARPESAAGARAPTASAAPPAPPSSLTPAEIAARAVPSLVTLRTGAGLGTGFVVRSEGWIATNLHVILSTSRVTATTHDGRQLEVVELLAASPEHDLALVRVDANDLTPLSLGDSDGMRLGDPVVAIGNPLGLEDTVSNGLVSGRRDNHAGIEVLQISAPIAPGSSGGPVFNDRGEVIAIAAAIVQGGQNINFGIPARYLAQLMERPTPMPFAEFARRLAQHIQASQGQGFAPEPLAILNGCDPGAQRLIVSMLADAITVGAPLYNQGDVAACYHVYDGTASDLLRKLPAGCRGPAHALVEAEARASEAPDVSAQAWVMRYAFDALLEVVHRKNDAQ